MNMIKLFLVLCLSAACGIAWAQTNAPAQNASELDITSTGSHFDGMANQFVYMGHVYVTDNAKVWLHCERLTIDMPKNGGHPTNILALTNVVIDLFDGHQTNRITCGQSVYAYHLSDPITNVVNAITNVVYATTNETITFTLDNPTVTSPDGIGTGDKLIYDVPTKSFSGITASHMKLRQSSGTNATPLDLFKK